MTLPLYIEKVGPNQLAKQLKVTRQSIHVWMNWKGAPKITVAYKLVMISKGELTLDKIYLPYLERKLRGKKFSLPREGKSPLQLEFKF